MQIFAKTGPDLIKISSKRADLRLVPGGGDFRTWLAEQGYSRRTCTLYAQLTSRCAHHMKESGRTLGRAKLDDLHSFWITVPPTRSSRNGVRNALLAYYKYRGHKDGAPADGLPNLPEPISLPRPRSEDDFAEFIAASHRLGGEHEVVGCLLGFTGCRISEAEHARWSQFDLHSSDPAWFIEGKGSRRRGPKVRKVDLNRTLLAVLLRHRVASNSADWLFPSTQSVSGHRGQTALRSLVTTICEGAAIERATPHEWRHTTATISLDRSRDIRALQELLGHASLATTQRYAAVLPGRLRALVDTLEIVRDA
jgi:integrase